MDIRWAFKTDNESSTFCSLIAKSMIDLFQISKEEAIQRINETWEGLSLVGSEDYIYHEDEDYWAKTIYYGKDSGWWLPEEKRRADGYGPLKPRDLQEPPNKAL